MESKDQKTIMENLTGRQLQIIRESINIISEQGIQGLTIKSLAKKIGISEPAIYRHFDSKIGILLTILDTFRQNQQLALTKIAVNNIPALKKLEEIFIYHFQAFTHNPALTAIIFSEEIFKNDQRLSERVSSIMKTNQQIISDILENGQSNDEIRNDISINHLALAIMGSLRLFVAQWRLTDFSFNLEREGGDLWDSVEKLISRS